MLSPAHLFHHLLQVKNYEYKKAEERGPLREAMNLLLPQLYGIITQVENKGHYLQLEPDGCMFYVTELRRKRLLAISNR